MNSKHIKISLLLLLIFSIFMGCLQAEEVDTAATAESISIYLVDNLNIERAMARDLNDLFLESQPLFTDKEIKHYSWKEQQFVVKESFSLEAALDGKVPIAGRPFVVMVDEERVFLGLFGNMLSSQIYTEIPTIYSIWSKDINNDRYRISHTKDTIEGNARFYDALKDLGLLIDE